METVDYNNKSIVRQGFLFRNKKNLAFGLVLFLIAFFVLLVPTVKVLILVPLLLLNWFVSWFKKKLRLRMIGVEFILFSTVVSGVFFGPVAGIIMGTLCILINYVVSRHKKKYAIVTIPLYALIGFVSSFIPSGSFVVWGIILAIAYNIASFSLSSAMGAKKWAVGVFSLTNILFNVFVFLQFGRFFLGFMGV